jgi:hypothetical protein
VQDLEIDLDVEEPSVSQAKLAKAVREFGGYLTANAGCIPNYGSATALGRLSPPRSSNQPSTR